MQKQARQPQAQTQEHLDSTRAKDRSIVTPSPRRAEPLVLDADMLKHVSGGAARLPHGTW